MKLNRKVVKRVTVTSTVLVVGALATFAGLTEEETKEDTVNIVIAGNGMAGVVGEINNIEFGVVSESGILTASIEKTQSELVSEGAAEEEAELAVTEESTETSVDDAEMPETENETNTENETKEENETKIENEPETAEIIAEEQIEEEKETEEIEETEEIKETEETEQPQSPEEAEWANRVMANVEEDMNIRTAPDENAELAGKFYRGDVAEIISVEGDWTQITSGNVSGYVKNDYLVYGMDAYNLANEVCSIYATVNTDGLRLRSEPNEEAGIVTTASNGDRLKVDKEAEETDGWVAVHTSDETAYVSAEYVGVALNLGTALNSEEVAEKEARKAEAEAAEKAKKPAVAANSDEVTLLGALIQCEAGSGSYEGMVAVGAVVMNRVRSGAYPGSISGVIYQGGQFTPAGNGSVASVAASGVSSACLQAAREAIAGADNTNGALSFRSAASGCAGTVIGANVFF